MRDKIGAFLVGTGSMTIEQVEEVLKAQKEGDKKLFGSIALERGYIEDNSIKRFLDYLAKNPDDSQMPSNK